jgi:hydrogenase expression/formation protein HypD
MNSSAFSDPVAVRALVETIGRHAARLGEVRLMEVCGTHTMEIGRLGIRQLLPANIRLISGPGCPVCVTPSAYIDAAATLALEKGVRIATFGDLFRVPGARTSFAKVKAAGAAIDVVASPRAALDLARKHAGPVVFTAVGFETTIPATAAAVKAAVADKIDNLSFFVAHRLVPPALDVLLADEALGISGFLLPGHVSAIIGANAYGALVQRGVPGVITGFAALDILAGICSLLTLLVKKEAAVKNEYTRVVPDLGNPVALRLIDEVYEPCDAVWRGIGELKGSGLRLRPAFSAFDAALRFNLASEGDAMPEGCSCGSVLKGIIAPQECELFGTACTPEEPVGPCMVSSEGSCAAAFRYGGRP